MDLVIQGLSGLSVTGCRTSKTELLRNKHFRRQLAKTSFYRFMFKKVYLEREMLQEKLTPGWFAAKGQNLTAIQNAHKWATNEAIRISNTWSPGKHWNDDKDLAGVLAGLGGVDWA